MTNKINGIDVSKYFIEVVDEGGSTINYKILPNFERLLVEKIFEQNQQLARLQEENEGLKSLNDFNVQKIEVLKEENEELKKLKKYYKGFVANCRYCDEWYMDKCNYIKKENKYKQALEEIRKKITPVCAYCNNIDGFTTWDDCENVCENGVIKYLKIIDEVLK